MATVDRFFLWRPLRRRTRASHNPLPRQFAYRGGICTAQHALDVQPHNRDTLYARLNRRLPRLLHEGGGVEAVKQVRRQGNEFQYSQNCGYRLDGHLYSSDYRIAHVVAMR